MGATTSKGEKDYTQFMKNYNIVTRKTDASYGDCKIADHKTDPENKILIKIKNAHDSDEQTEAIKIVELRKKLGHRNLCNVLGYFEIAHKDLCSDSVKQIIIFEFYNYNMRKEITRRKAIENNGEKFWTENEINYIIDSIINLELEYHKVTGHYLGDLRTSNIMITEQGHIKLCDTTLHFGFDILQKITKGFEVQLPLPPELLSLNTTGYIPKDMNSEKIEMWVLGILILCAATLHSEEYFYKNQFCEIRKKRIENAIKSLRETGYSDNIEDLIKKCLSVNPKERPSFAEFGDYLEFLRDLPNPTTGRIDHYLSPEIVPNIIPTENMASVVVKDFISETHRSIDHKYN